MDRARGYVWTARGSLANCAVGEVRQRPHNFCQKEECYALSRARRRCAGQRRCPHWCGTTATRTTALLAMGTTGPCVSHCRTAPLLGACGARGD